MSDIDPQELENMKRARGVATFDYDNGLLLVEAPVGDVAGALAKLRPGAKHIQEAGKTGITLTVQSFIVARIKGHAWTLVYDQVFKKSGGLREQDAEEISKLLGCRAMYYGNSDTAAALVYELYDKGVLVEKMGTGEGYEIIDFESPGRGVEADSIEDATGYVEGLFKDLDAYEPGFGFRNIAGYIMFKPGDKISLGGLNDLMERVDHVTLDAAAAKVAEGLVKKRPMSKKMKAYMAEMMGGMDGSGEEEE